MKARLFIIGAAAVVTLGAIAVGLLFAPGLVDWTPYRSRVAAAIEELTGTRVTIAGEVDFRFLPSPRFVASRVTLSDPQGDHATDLLTIRTLDISLDSWALLGGRAHVSAVSLARPVLTLQRFDRGLAGVFASLAPWADRPFTVTEAAVTDGIILYRDLLSGDEHRIERLDVTIRSDDPRGPHRITGTLAWRNLAMGVDATLGQPDARGVASLDAEIGLTGTDSTVRFAGRLHPGASPVLRGALAVTSGNAVRDLRALAVTEITPGEETGTDPRRLHLSADLSVDPDGVEATALELEFGKARLEGEARVTRIPHPEVDISLTLARANLGTLEEVTRAGAVIARGLFDAGWRVALPHDIGGTLTLSSDAVDVGGSPVRHLRLESALDGGALTVRHFTAELPGGTLTRVAGTLHATADTPRFVGEIDATSNDLRSLLGWLDLPIGDMPPDRLRTGRFRSGIDVTRDRLDLSPWRIGLDATQIKGGMSALFGRRPAFGLGVFADRIALDPYLALAAGGPGRPADEARDRLAAVLQRFDANILLEIDEAKLRGAVLRKVRLAAGIDHGQITLSDLSVGDADDGSYALTGTLGGSGAQEVDLGLEIRNGSIPGLARLLDVTLAPELAALDRFGTSSTVTGTMAGLDVAGTVTSADGTLTVAGRVVPASPPEFLLRLELDHPDTGALAGRLLRRPHARLEHLGPGTANITLVSRKDRQVEFRSVLQLASGRLALDGVADPVGADPAVDVRLQLSHPDLVQLIRLNDPGFSPVLNGSRALELSARLEGTASALVAQDIDARIGPTGVRGSGRIDRTGARPAIGLTLQAGPLDLGPWLPAGEPAASGGVAPVPASRGGWSHEPWDFSGFQAFDLALDLEADRVEYNAYVIDDPVLKASLVGGTAEVAHLRGGLHGGTVEGSGRLATSGVPDLELELSVTGARLGAPDGTADLPVSGLLDYSAGLSGQGRSEFELVSSLRGQGTVVLADGTVHGIDLPAASARLPEIERAADLLTMLRETTSAGVTPFGRIGGSFAIRDGVVRSGDLVVDAPSASGTADVTLDLPVREFDVASELSLTDHPRAPPLGVRLVGSAAAPRVELEVERMQDYVLQRMKRTGVLQRLGAQPRAVPRADGRGADAGKPGTGETGPDVARPGSGRAEPRPADPEPRKAGPRPQTAGPDGGKPGQETVPPGPRDAAPRPDRSRTPPADAQPEPGGGKSGTADGRRDFQSILEGLLK